MRFIMAALPAALADQDLTRRTGASAWSGVVADADSMVGEFCAKHGLHDLVDTAVQLAAAEMKPQHIQLELSSGPEGDGEWVVIRTEVRATVDEALDRYSACKNAWLREAPASKQGFVRFIYNIL